MSVGFQMESEPFLNVKLAFTHPAHGSVSHYIQDFSPFNTIKQLKQDMAGKLAVPVEKQVWKYKGDVLYDAQTLDDVNLDDGDVIEVSSRAA
ncbi:hypothetical protein V1264_016200 [Littorina saxatilis]|uniref:Ubiquitin-like domain-containing protein n=1 Tax=Littorina saxatilis TaxID=31220 RepID=A0AAN9BNG6_9CAEN